MIPYLQVENLTRYWGETPLFEDISYTIAQGSKVALIAKNGTGKTTMLNIIMGLDSQDSGTVTIAKDIKTGYLCQNPEMNLEHTILEEVYNTSGVLTDTIREYEKALLDNNSDRLQLAMEKMDQENAWDFEQQAKQILSRLKLTKVDQKIKQLSGGQKKRVALATVLINNPDLIILDEPTNHLDLDMIEWLEEYLTKTRCTLFMVTHDRYFLDRVCNEILEIDNNILYRYKGNYTYFLEKREERREHMQADIDKARNLMRTELEWVRRMPKARGTKSKSRMGAFDDLKGRANKSLSEEQLKIQVQASRLGKKVINIDHINKSFGDIKIVNDFSYKFARFEKVGIIGENGTGKSTFLNMLTSKMQPDHGTVDIGETVRFGYYRQDGIEFSPKSKVIDAITDIAEVIDLGNGNQMTAAQFLTKFLFPHKEQQNQIEKLSGGEKRRLYLCSILIQNPNFLILDEPTNDLDIATLNILEEYLLNFSGCVIVVSHDRYFMDKIVDHLFVFKGEGEIKDFPGNYTVHRDALEREKSETSKETIQPKQVKREVSRTRKLTFKEKKEMETLEHEIERLSTEKDEIEISLNDGSLSSEELQEKSIRYSEIKDILDDKELRWLELSEI